MPLFKLPFEIDVEMRSYHNKAFPLGIIKANLSENDYDIWLSNKLINCVYIKSELIESSYSLQVNLLDNDIWSVEDGLLISQGIYIDPYYLSMDGLNLIEFNKSMIQHGNYVTGIYDEYYTPNQEPYQSYHFTHDYLLIGYNDEKNSFQAAGYMADKRYQYYDIAYDDYYQAVVRGSTNRIFIKYLKYNNAYQAKLEITKIKIELENYLYSRVDSTDKTENRIYGLEAWDNFAEDIGMLTVEETVDLRYARAYMEHFIIMSKRIEVLTTLGYVSNLNIRNVYGQIAETANLIFIILLKHNIAHRKNLLISAFNKMKEIACLERQFLPLLIENISTNIQLEK